MHRFIIAAIVVSAIAAVFDWRTGKIPDWLTLTVLLLAPIAHVVDASITGQAFTNMPWYEGLFSLFGALIAAAVPLILFRQNAIGGGDVKLFAALGALLQIEAGIEAELYAMIAAAIAAPAFLAYKGKLLSSLRNAGALLVNPVLPKDKRKTIEPETLTWFRLGPCVLVGTLAMAYVRMKSKVH